MLILAGAVSLMAFVTPALERNMRTVVTQLTGEVEVPGPGDPDAVGAAMIGLDLSQQQVCFRLKVEGLSLPATGAHIHEGESGVAGPVILTLTPPDESGFSQGCVSAEPEVMRAIAHHPAGYYVNIHTSDYPDGALRGQLR